MIRKEKGTLAPERWNPENFHIEEKHWPAFDRLLRILGEIDSPIAQQLLDGRLESWSPGDLERLKFDVLSRLSSAAGVTIELDDFLAADGLAIEVKSLMDLLAKVINGTIRKHGLEAPRPQYFRRVPLETNPFHINIKTAEQTLIHLNRVVERGFSNQSNGVEDTLALALLSSIASFQLLDLDQQAAWLEAVAHKTTNSIVIQRRCCLQLQVAFHNQAHAERRLYIADRRTSKLIGTLDHTVVLGILDGVTNLPSHPDSPKSATQQRRLAKTEIARYLEDIVEEFVRAHVIGEFGFTLPDVTAAARTFAYLNLPSAIAAYRCRKTISHSPRLQVLRRIHSGIPITSSEMPAMDGGDDIDSNDLTEAEIHDSSELEPEWYMAIRSAFQCSGKRHVRIQLGEVARSSGPIGRCMADFALNLLHRHAISTAERYSLLISRRLGCGLYDSADFDPRQLSVADLEPLYEEILDEDRESSASQGIDGLSGYDKRPIVTAIVKFHRFLQKEQNVGELVELKDRLRPIGLLPVDANFITIDEYLDVLTEVDRDVDLNDLHFRGAIKQFISICFWCGLRREEARGLRVSDLDAAGHLHVRPYEERRLKTSNARRTIPVSQLMPEDIYQELVEWIRERSAAPRSGDVALLFSQKADASKLLAERSFYNTIITILRRSVRDESLKIHHLRHSFATLLAAKLLPGMQMFLSVFLSSHRHPRTREWLQNSDDLRLRLFGNLQVRKHDLAGIAHMLGHGSPAMSVEHYIHCLDWCAFNDCI